MIKALFLLPFLTPAFAADGPVDAVFGAIRSNNLSQLESLTGNRAAANVADDRGFTALMYAAYAGSPEAMKILIDKGADVNARNAFESTALMMSTTDLKKVRLLVEHGADVNARSKQGRTAALIAALSDSSAEIVRLLIGRGADLKTVDALHTTLLIAAAQGNDTETIRLFVDAGLDVNARDFRGFTPLIYAAGNANTAAVRMLLAKGANVNAVSFDKGPPAVVKNGPIELGYFTALIAAAPFAPPELIKVLLDAGADVNAKDVRGMTPLMLAMGTDHSHPEVVGMLLAKGADASIKSGAGETARDWAAKFGSTASLGALNGGVAADPPGAPVRAANSSLDSNAAAEKSLALIEKMGSRFFINGGCSSCHSQNIVDIAAAAARSKGLRVDEKQTVERQKLNRAFFGSMVPLLLERIDPPGANDVVVYAMAGMAAAGYAPDRMTDGIVANIALHQNRDGHWMERLVARPPMEESDFFRTALSVRALKIYGTPGRRAEFDARIARAKSWLLAAKATTAEDRNFQLMGVKWAGGDDASIRRLAAGIAGHQREDGGWAPIASLESSDAYATGESLYALAEAGMPPKDAVYQKGVKFLLGTQRPDGSWFVKSRAPKFQPYFESGFPYGHDQWISAMATGWATAALARGADAPVKKSAE